LKPYPVRQGDYVQSLADQLGFDADTIWNDPKNAQLKQLRGNPNILFPGDILYVPDQEPTARTLKTGATNSFVSSPVTVPVTIKFSSARFASQACTIEELPDLTGLTTDANGTLTFSVPVTLDAATVAFTEIGATYVFKIGHLDPMGTLSGVFQRLQNLGFFPRDATLDDANVESLRAHLRLFKATQGGGDPDPAAPAPASQTPSYGDPPPADPTQQDSAQQEDDAGLSDDGTLDAATAAMLLAAHGS
jgi:N-acetylmuramoyl-L-alanine amidase